MNLFTIGYSFTFEDGKEKIFQIQLRKPQMQIVYQPQDSPPFWTELANHQCSNCPLSPEDHPHCPIALSMVDVVEHFKNSASFEQVEVRVSTPQRQYVKKTSLQEGVGSLIGLYMASSGCPIMDKLRPMVGSHLPFASMEETVYRAITMYLMSQYFQKKEGREPDWELVDLAKIYEEINLVNRDFTRRLLNINLKDANLNALVRLDCYALTVHSSIVKDSLGKLKSLFHAYL